MYLALQCKCIQIKTHKSPEKPGLLPTLVFIEETWRIGLLRIQDHKWNYKNGELKSKLVCHVLDTNHVPDFETIDVLSFDILIFINNCL